MVKVIAFPPVGAVGSEWTHSNPVQVSKSLVTGRRFVSAWGRNRRKATVMVSALAKDRSGAGYSEMLKRHLDGGVHLVRLNSYPINWHLDAARLAGARDSALMGWTQQGDPLSWEHEGQPLVWFNGNVISATVSGYEMEVTGLPPRKLIARPGEYVRAFENLTDEDGPAAQITAVAHSDESGVAVLRLFDELADGAYPRVNIGASASAVFAVDAMPRAVQPLGRNWQYEWRFTEVFADEVDELDEVNPWN